jgi:hypothetical protein
VPQNSLGHGGGFGSRSTVTCIAVWRLALVRGLAHYPTCCRSFTVRLVRSAKSTTSQMQTSHERALSLITPKSGVQVYPTRTNTRTLSATASFFHRCETLHNILLRISSFRPYIEAAVHPDFPPNDHVNLLWTCFAQGLSLIHLHDLIPGIDPLGRGFNESALEKWLEDSKLQQHAVAMFSMALPQLEPKLSSFKVTDLWNDRSSLDGFMKVRAYFFKLFTTVA